MLETSTSPGPAAPDTRAPTLTASPAIFSPTSVEAVFGSLAYAGKAKSIAEMDAAIAAEAKRHARD